MTLVNDLPNVVLVTQAADWRSRALGLEQEEDVPMQQPAVRSAAPADGTPAMPRPESLLLTLFGAHLLGRDLAVGVGGVIDVLGRLGVGEHATRATLKRMMQRGLLRTVRRGRRAYTSLTPYAEAVLQEGAARLDAEVVNRSWDGHWTLLAFSVPESRRQDRHALRVQLSWAGFGMLQNGLWIAPSPGDPAHALAELGLLDYVRMFRAQAVAPADPRALVGEVWDLSGLALGYRRFVDRWDNRPRADLDELSCQILLEAEWLLLIREDPRLPIALLPDDWPAVRAEELFGSLRRELIEPARDLAATLLEWAPADATP
jgi:DNA-binding transcriptional regulator PaaX